jgi:hypothetical protein
MIAVFMTADLSWGIWEGIEPLQRVQFPWRFCAVLSVAILPLIGFFLDSVLNKGGGRWLWLGIFCSLWCLCLGINVKPIWQLLASDASERRALLRAYKDNDAPEYKPTWVKTTVAHGMTEKLRIVSGTGEIALLKWYPPEIMFVASNAVDLRVMTRHYYFPTFHAEADGRIPVPMSPFPASGFQVVDVPNGNHLIVIRRNLSLPEKLGFLLTCCSTLGAAAVWWLAKRPARVKNSLVCPKIRATHQ